MITGNKEINLYNEFGSATLLGSSAFFSGFVWQPTVNFFGFLGFTGCAFSTGLVCSLVFFAALRFFRIIYSSILAVEKGTYINLKKDAQLSFCIGGASACFVATDPLLPGNILGNIFGVTPTMSPLLGMTLAGSSTGTGYGILQCGQNLLPNGKNWLDENFK